PEQVQGLLGEPRPLGGAAEHGLGAGQLGQAPGDVDLAERAGVDLAADAGEQVAGAGGLVGPGAQQQPRVADAEPAEVAGVLAVAGQHQRPLGEGDALLVLAADLGDVGGLPVGDHAGAGAADPLGALDQLPGELPGPDEVAALDERGEQRRAEAHRGVGGVGAGRDELPQRVLGGLHPGADVAALAQAAAQRDVDVRPVVEVGLGGRLPAQLGQPGDRLLQLARGLQREGVAPPRLLQHLRQRHRVGAGEDLGEPRPRLGRRAVAQRDLGVVERDAQLVHDVLADAADEVGRRAVQLGREQLDHARRGHPLVALDQRDVAVGQLGEGELRLAHAPPDPQGADALPQSLPIHTCDHRLQSVARQRRVTLLGARPPRRAQGEEEVHPVLKCAEVAAGAVPDSPDRYRSVFTRTCAGSRCGTASPGRAGSRRGTRAGYSGRVAAVTVRRPGITPGIARAARPPGRPPGSQGGTGARCPGTGGLACARHFRDHAFERGAPVMSDTNAAATDASPPAGGRGPLERLFHLSERGTTVPRELRGGVTTFFAMAYIILLNPIILGGAQDVTGAQLSIPQLTTMTAVSAAIATVIMGLVGNAPLALAAGLGINAVVAFQAAPVMTWPQAMGLVVIEGAIIVVLALTGIRE